MAQLNIGRETHARLSRLSHLCGKPMSQLVADYSASHERQWRERMSADVFERFLKNDVSLCEAKQLCEDWQRELQEIG